MRASDGAGRRVGAHSSVRTAVLVAVVCFSAACSSPEAPANPVTLLVTNTTCATQACTPLEIHAIVPKFTVPGQPPWGFLDIGAANSTSTCLMLPQSRTLTVTGPAGGTATTWTPADPIVLTAVDGDLVIRGRTTEFVPADAAGWAVSFGGASPTEPVATTGCTP